MKAKTIKRIQILLAAFFFAWMIVIPFEMDVYNGVTLWIGIQAVVACTGTAWFSYCAGALK